MTDRIYNVLFLCTGNSARSILAEGILRKEGVGRFNAYSAGSTPKGGVNPFALKVLAALDYPTDGLRSKAWDGCVQRAAPLASCSWQPGSAYRHDTLGASGSVQ